MRFLVLGSCRVAEWGQLRTGFRCLEPAPLWWKQEEPDKSGFSPEPTLEPVWWKRGTCAPQCYLATLLLQLGFIYLHLDISVVGKTLPNKLYV